MIERTIVITIGNDVMEIPYITFDEEMTEDELYEAAVDYVMTSINIDLI